jgi:hypothetical protein
MRRSIVPLSLLAATLVAAAPAGAKSRPVWASINVCDTIAHPDSIGIRASMPGGARKNEQMFMRFQVQYFRGADSRWHPISKGADSGFVLVGTGRFQARQAGRMFVFAPPAGGGFELRGKVSFQWRLNGRVVAHAGRLTTAGHRSAVGADPAGYSAATCVIS